MNSQYSKQHQKEYKAGYCTLYSEIDFKRYLAGAMSPSERELFEEHCVSDNDEHTCDDCSSQLARIDKSHLQEQDLLNEERMMERTRELLNKLIQP